MVVPEDNGMKPKPLVSKRKDFHSGPTIQIVMPGRKHKIIRKTIIIHIGSVIDSLRTHFSPIALEYMDCSEFVCRVLYADELSNTVLPLNTTKGLYEFLNHSDKFTFSDHTPRRHSLMEGSCGHRF